MERIPRELNETVSLMQSTDYKERFKAEYFQLKIRYDKLKAMVEKLDSGELEFEPDTPRSVYDLQLRAMEDYFAVLQARAAIEGIEIKEE